MYNPNQLKSC